MNAVGLINEAAVMTRDRGWLQG